MLMTNSLRRKRKVRCFSRLSRQVEDGDDEVEMDRWYDGHSSFSALATRRRAAG